VIKSMDDGTKRRRLNPVHSFLPDDLLLPIVSHLDVKTLIEKKQVCRNWRHACTEAIDAKQTPATKKVFSTKEQLRQAVEKYCGYNKATDSYSQCTPHDAEEIAQTYGYPINKWDVSIVKNFAYLFHHACTFNEDISSWNVSSATSMKGMFFMASAFNQDLSLWNVSNVTDMQAMFGFAESFDNGSISSWDVSNVTDMGMMFYYASSFNQNLSLWNVTNVCCMRNMFANAASFDQDMDSWGTWDVSKLS
jgi:surface protein